MPKLTDPQVQMLRSIKAGQSPMAHCHGRSAHGGATRTLQTLRRLGLVESTGGGFALTNAGRNAVYDLSK